MSFEDLSEGMDLNEALGGNSVTLASSDNSGPNMGLAAAVQDKGFNVSVAQADISPKTNFGFNSAANGLNIGKDGNVSAATPAKPAVAAPVVATKAPTASPGKMA